MTRRSRVGDQGEFYGVYTAHWEIPRFVSAVARGQLGTEWCQLTMSEELWAELRTAVGAEWWEEQRHRPPRTLEVRFRGEIVERGRFGHKGISRWRIRVDERLELGEPTEFVPPSMTGCALTAGAALALVAAVTAWSCWGA